MSHVVFMSHSTKDKAFADTVCTALETAGIKCWIAPRDIRSGELFPEAIAEAMATSKLMVLIFSANSNRSKDVANELILAMNSGIAVVPLKIDETSPRGVMRYYLTGAHWQSALDPPYEKHILRFVGTIKDFLSKKIVTSDTDTDSNQESIATSNQESANDSRGKFKKDWPPLFWILLFFILLFPMGTWSLYNLYQSELLSVQPGQVIHLGLPSFRNTDNNNSSVIPEKARGNSPGNIVNNGMVTEQDGWIYYLNSNEENEIFKIRTDGSERTRINEDSSAFLNVSGEWIYYINRSQYDKIYMVLINGSKNEPLLEDSASYLNLVDDWIFYINNSHDGKVYKVRTDGSERTRLTMDRADYLSVTDDWIYYVNNNHFNRIYKARTDGQEVTRINDEHSRTINIVNDWIYYINEEEDSRIYKIRIDGSGKTQVSRNQSRFINVTDDWIYYANFGDGGRLYKIRTNGTDNVLLHHNSTGYINLLDEWIYYLDRDEGDRMHKIRIDGSGRQFIN